MNKFNLKAVTLSAFLLLLVCMLTAITGCGKTEISDITISASNPPRIEYVEGQELDLTKGSITVKEGKKEKTVALSDTGVTVSGYDKSKIGKQTLSVEYGGKSTSYEITVIARIVISDFKNVYFVGDELDLSVGKVRLANDDATTVLIDFSDTRLSFEGFSSSEAGDKTVTVTYSDGSGKSYKSSFTVNVYSNDIQVLLEDVKNTLSVIPSGWTASSLGNYESEISEAVNLIFVLKQNQSTDGIRETLNLLDGLRADGDISEIIYSYYCYTAADGHSFIKNSLWQILPLPDMLEEWYESVFEASVYAAFLAENGESSAFLSDTTDFMLHYFLALEAADRVRNGNDTLSKDIYSIINGDLIIENNLRIAYGGYITHMGEMLGHAKHENLWKEYLALASLEKQGLLSIDGNAEQIERVFSLLCSLSPAELHGFLSSLNFLYEDSDGSILISDYSEKQYNLLFTLLSRYYESKLPTQAKQTFKQLLMAMESYSLACMSKDGVTEDNSFENLILSVKTAYGSLSDSDKEVFNSLIGAPYEKYLGIYGALTDENEPQYSEIGDDVEQLNLTLKRYFNLLSVISDSNVSSEEKEPLFTLLFSLYERANGIYGKINLSENSADLATFYTETYKISAKSITLDTAFYISREVFVSYLVSTPIEDVGNGAYKLLWDGYTASGLNIFLKDASFILEYMHFGASIDKSTVDSIMTSFRNLDKTSQKIFYMMGSTLYYDGLESFYHESLSNNESAKQLATALLEAEYAYVNYVQNNSNGEALAIFKNRMEIATSLLSSVSSDIINSYFKAIYDCYYGIYTSNQ